MSDETIDPYYEAEAVNAANQGESQAQEFGEQLPPIDGMPEDIKKKIELECEKEAIYEPKYGGKDHSGYGTMMLYEVNGERMEAFENGEKFGYSLLQSNNELLARQLLRYKEENERLKVLLETAVKIIYKTDPFPIWKGSIIETEEEYWNKFKTENKIV